MKIYNTYTNKLETFIPNNEGKLNIYVCGPTVNKKTHIGHMYPAVFFDTLVRYFRYKGYQVTYASNFTDVDDKIIQTAIEQNITEKEVADKYEKYYLNDLSSLNCIPVDYRPRVTEYIDEIIDFINLLITTNHAYKNGDDVYFDINSIDNYGSLSNQKTENLDYGNRIEIDTNKKNPYDFVLWKSTDQGIKWQAPFGEGRPGWHTECVVMINKIFNGKIDIHGGGIDLVFPHHENEIAQQQAAYNNNLASYWMHNGHIKLDGEKMSKSIGNVITVKELLNTYTPNTIRLSMLKNHYRAPLNISADVLEESKTIDNKILSAIKQTNLYINVNNLTVINIKDKTFEEYMDDDFNTSLVIAYLLDTIKNINISLRNNNTNEILKLYSIMTLIINILGLTYDIKQITNEDKEIYNLWNTCKASKDYTNADIYRKQLEERNII
ncbi:MAG: cysteine--tRNA ligase [Bacilli bacterium]